MFNMIDIINTEIAATTAYQYVEDFPSSLTKMFGNNSAMHDNLPADECERGKNITGDEYLPVFSNTFKMNRFLNRPRHSRHISQTSVCASVCMSHKNENVFKSECSREHIYK